MASNIVRETTDGIYNLILGLVVTFKHLFKHAITLQYPTERWEMPERSRGTIVLLSDPETGRLNCTACLLCAKACPVAAISIDRIKNPDTKKFEPQSFNIDTTICCYCGLCEQACNFTAIKLTGKYEFSVSDKSKLLYDMGFLQEIGRDVKYEKREKAVKKKVAAKAEAGDETGGSSVAEGQTESSKDSGEAKKEE